MDAVKPIEVRPHGLCGSAVHGVKLDYGVTPVTQSALLVYAKITALHVDIPVDFMFHEVSHCFAGDVAQP